VELILVLSILRVANIDRNSADEKQIRGGIYMNTICDLK
jgi:hypothetical protein